MAMHRLLAGKCQLMLRYTHHSSRYLTSKVHEVSLGKYSQLLIVFILWLQSRVGSGGL